jgi:ADP-heptose:LPS heptosyltransferase
MRAPSCAAILRLDALGDSLLALPAVEALGRAWPQTRLVVVASTVGYPVFAGCAEVWVGTEDLARRLQEIGCEVVLSFTEKRPALQAAARSGASVRVGFDPGRTQPLKSLWLRTALTHRVPWPNCPDRDPGMHEVERFFLLLGALGLDLPHPPPPLRFTPGEEDRAWARDFLASFDSPPVAVQWMPRWTAGGWPETLVGEVVDRLGGPKAVLFAPPDQPRAEPWARQRGLEWSCTPELGRYAAVLSGCRALITPDGGAAHVAAAVGTPVVDLFFQRHSAHTVRRWHPWRVEHRIVLRGDYVAGAEKDLAERLVASVEELCRSNSAS